MPKTAAEAPSRTEVQLAARIAWERQRKGWSYQRLADEMGKVGCQIGKQSLNAIEKLDRPRHVTIDELVALSSVFGVSIEELLVPVEAVEKQTAMEVLETVDKTTEAVVLITSTLFNLNRDLAEMSWNEPELHEYITRRLDAARSRELPMEGDIVPDKYVALARIAADYLTAIADLAKAQVSEGRHAKSKPARKRTTS